MTTKIKAPVIINAPTNDAYGTIAYTWPHVYGLDVPQVRSMRVKKCAVDLAKIFDMYEQDGITATLVLKKIIERESSSAEVPEIADDDDDDDDKMPEWERRLLHRHGETEELEIIYDLSPTIRVWAAQMGRSLAFNIAGEQGDDLRRHADWLREHFPVKETVSSKVSFDFVYGGEYGAETVNREIPAVSWDAIRANYSPTVLPKLDELVHFTPSDGTAGKIGILLGPPGTGKTHLIRALSREWKAWASFKYILDTERFFTDPGYMLDLVLKSTDRKKWNVILCEDAEEYIAPDSKKKVGQALSRLVNMGDGLIGQGLRLILLFTTNAPNTDLHEAITRAGRCFAKVEIPALTPEEATQWLGRRVTEDMSLASLYELRSKSQIVAEPSKASVGLFL